VNYWIFMLVGKDTPSSSFEIEKTGRIGLDSEPTRGKDAQAMRMSDEQRITSKLPNTRDDPIHSASHILGSLSTRTWVSKNSPIRNAFADLRCG
jgi:hypothetical protein